MNAFEIDLEEGYAEKNEDTIELPESLPPTPLGELQAADKGVVNINTL